MSELAHKKADKFLKKDSKFNPDKVEEAVKMLLEGFGEDINREGLKDTPARVTGYWAELLEGSQYTNKEIANMFNTSFEVGHDPIVTIYGDNLYSTCEHHLAGMFDGDIIVGYIPIQNEDSTYKVLGLSKLYRIIELCCKRLQLQEKIACDIAECISLATGSTEVYVNLNMKHMCVSARGAKAHGCTNVTYMTPALRRNISAREEFERKSTELLKRI